MSATRASGTGSAADGSSGHLRVTQVKSSISSKPKHRGTLRALGLRGVGKSRVLPDRPDVRGMVARVPHLVTVHSAHEDEATEQRQRADEALRARRASHGIVNPDDPPAAPTRARRATKETS